MKSPEMMEIMGLRGGQEREVVPTVGDGGTEQCQAVPQGGRGHMGAQDNGPHYHWQHVRDLWQREVTNTVCLLSRTQSKLKCKSFKH